jgi:hypothetical protein
MATSDVAIMAAMFGKDSRKSVDSIAPLSSRLC